MLSRLCLTEEAVQSRAAETRTASEEAIELIRKNGIIIEALPPDAT